MTERNYIIAGNWKMNGNIESTSALINGLVAGVNDAPPSNTTWIVFPPFPYLSQVAGLLAGTKIHHGAQNICTKEKGAFTGEVAVSMVREFGCDYVLVGHSERRHIYKESDKDVAAKFIQVTSVGLTPILCVGETLEEREANQAESVVKRQIDAILKLDNGIDLLEKAIIAYEPVWAIGTGITAIPEQAQEMHAMIREHIRQSNAIIAEKLNILYGGSLKPANAKELLAMPDIDGGLIGGASLDAESFLAIGKARL